MRRHGADEVRHDARPLAERGAQLAQAGERERARDDEGLGLSASRRCQRASEVAYRADSAGAPRQLSLTPGSVLRPWQRVQSAPCVKHVPTAQTRR